MLGFFSPGGGSSSSRTATSPASLEIISKGHFVDSSGAVSDESRPVPLVETVPGPPTRRSKRSTSRSARPTRRAGKTIYYGTLPKNVPERRLPDQVRMIFAGLGAASTPADGDDDYKAPCPRK